MSLSIQVYTSLVQGQQLLFSIEPNAYSHELRAMGGWWQAAIRSDDRRDRIENWLEEGLGRHIEVYDEGQTLVFEGFVNKVSVNLGPLTAERGPLLDVANRVKLIYSTVDTSVSPPVFGVRASTGTVSDTASQDKWGIIDQVLSAGGSTQTAAEQIRDTFLSERKNPTTTQTLALGGQGGPSVSLEVLGYVHWLFYPYNSTTTGTQNLSAKLEAILGTDPNSIFSTDYSQITANTFQVKAWENDNDLAWSLVKGLTALGDSSDNRHIFGVYAARRPAYGAIPTEADYQQQIGTNSQVRQYVSGASVRPWQVLPGKWIFVSDLLPGRSQPPDLRLDPRMIFIESVQYSMPWSLQIQGGKTDTLSQKLAKYGLAGVGA